MRVRAYGGTDVGRQRNHNEDSFLVDQQVGVFAVADGMGGHNAGEVASQMVINLVREQASTFEQALHGYRQTPDEQRRRVIQLLPKTLEQANFKVFEAAQQDPHKRGMGTTAIVFLPMERDAFVCHVGDSRLYLFREGHIYQVTEDHSLVMNLYKQGLITKEELATHPHKNVILRGIGLQPTIDVDTLYLNLFPGDVFLLCSDGLSDMVDEDELRSLMSSYRGQELVRMAIATANRYGGQDNITVVVLEVFDDVDTEVAPTREMPRLGINEKVAFLRNMFLFAQCNFQECLKVNRIIYEQHFARFTPIIEEGQLGDELFIVAKGSVDVWRGDVFLTSIGPGGHFGELGMITNAPRSARVVAGDDSTLFVIKRSDFLQLISDDRDLGNKILWAFLQNLTNRVRDLSARLSHS